MLSVNLPAYTIEGKKILHKIAFTLADGENLTILGANGAGKSTLAKLLCGLLPSAKAVSIDGKVLAAYTPCERAEKINYIPPKLSIYETYMTLENFLQLSRYRRTAKEEQLHEVLRLLHLHDFRKRYCSGLSSGEQQLLLLASALMHGAQITIFDEPTANLDPKKSKTVFEILQGAWLQQKIVITHDLQLAYRLGYKILYIDEGRGEFYEKSDLFFSDENLMKIFAGSVTKKCGAIVVSL